MNFRLPRSLAALCLTALLAACMEAGPAEAPPPAQSRSAEFNLYRTVCVATAQSGDFSGLASQLRRLGFTPGISVGLSGSFRNLVQGWAKPGSDVAVFIGASERKQDFCAVVFPGTNPVTGLNAPVAEARLWYLKTLEALGRDPAGLISSAPIRVTGTNGAASTLSFEIAAGGLSVYAANYY